MKRFVKTLDVSGYQDQDYQALIPGQWVSCNGSRGRYAGIKHYVVCISWSRKTKDFSIIRKYAKEIEVNTKF